MHLNTFQPKELGTLFAKSTSTHTKIFQGIDWLLVFNVTKPQFDTFLVNHTVVQICIEQQKMLKALNRASKLHCVSL